ncbi:MAG: energy transducer TonB family protein [Candidatus Acidiferrales bacterium]
MIPRLLVPVKLRPLTADDEKAQPRRLTTLLDERTVIPSNMPIAPIDARSRIPLHLPLDVLAQRMLIPRDTPVKPFEQAPGPPDMMPVSILDTRTVVPAGLESGPLVEDDAVPHTFIPTDVIEPDVITTGEVNLMDRPVDTRGADWNQIARFASLITHIVLVSLIILSPKIFPNRAPSKEDMELARKQLSFVYLPPSADEVPKAPPSAQPPSPKMRVDPRVLRKVAPPEMEYSPPPGAPAPTPAVPSVQPNLPAAPSPQIPRTQQQAPQTQPAPQMPKLENVPPPKPDSGFALPQMSPGKSLQQSLQGALKGREGPAGGGFADPVPHGPVGGGGGGQGGAPQGYLGGNLQMLTPTEGVDFTNYLARLLASVKRNWYAIIPESARLGEQGRVMLRFKVYKDGVVAETDPVLERTSGKDPLDRAAMSSIRASSPFEPLPPAFSGPYIELRFIFLYNLPIDYQ